MLTNKTHFHPRTPNPEPTKPTSLFPTTKPASAGGPPYNFTPEAYKAQLEHPGEKIYTNDTDAIVDDKYIGIPPAKDGLKRLLHIKPQRTHPAGMDGDVVEDWISVWAHNS